LANDEDAIVRITIDARYINDHFPGIGRYVYNLLRALADLDQQHMLVAIYNPALPNTRYDMAALSRYPRIRLVATRLRPFSLAEQFILPRMLKTMQSQLYHAPYYVRPYFKLPCPSIVTLYDAIPHLFPHEVSPRARWLFDLLTRQAARSSRHILAISASARDDLARAYRIPLDRITVTPLAADRRFQPQSPTAIAAVRAKYDLPERYVLSLASNKPHKNLVGLVEAFAKLLQIGDWRLETGDSHLQSPISNLQLVLAGHWDPRYPEARMAVQRLGLSRHVRFLPDVAEADLPALYSGAEIFAFASRYEGFGLPPLEAMACGAPVLCCNTSSLPEVVGDAAVRVAPTPEALAAGLAKLLGDDALRLRLRSAGPQRASQFSWRETAEATLAVYERVAAKVQTFKRSNVRTS
jgi:glycosyltransferase involved in cell wall biosynthesis